MKKEQYIFLIFINGSQKQYLTQVIGSRSSRSNKIRNNILNPVKPEKSQFFHLKKLFILEYLQICLSYKKLEKAS